MRPPCEPAPRRRPAARPDPRSSPASTSRARCRRLEVVRAEPYARVEVEAVGVLAVRPGARVEVELRAAHARGLLRQPAHERAAVAPAAAVVARHEVVDVEV